MSAIRVARPAFKHSKTFYQLAATAGLLGTAAVVYGNNQNNSNNKKGNGLNKALFGFGAAPLLNTAVVPAKGFKEYQDIYNAIATKVRDHDEYEDGSYGPVLVRLAWHSSGSYEKETHTGGSYGGTMRFSPEKTDPANNGLENARNFLEEFKGKYPWLSYGDLWTLGGVVSVQELGGPKIKWRPGREDLKEDRVPPNGRLPDAAQGAQHIRDVFVKRMGLTEKETVALIGAHCLGRCHADRSGFDGPWTFSPTFFTNDFYTLLLKQWHVRKWDGPVQYEDNDSKSLMMLPADYALKEDSKFLQYVEAYAKDQELFFKDFAPAFQKLLEFGINFPKGSPEYTFSTLDEQE